MNNFVRFEWALTEERPEAKACFENRWAELPDQSLRREPRHATL